MRERRSKDKIILEVLSICTDGENITRIVYQANTNFTTIRAYLDLLIKNGLVESSEGSPTLYKTTQKGMQMKVRLKMLHDELEVVTSSPPLKGQGFLLHRVGYSDLSTGSSPQSEGDDI